MVSSEYGVGRLFDMILLPYAEQQSILFVVANPGRICRLIISGSIPTLGDTPDQAKRKVDVFGEIEPDSG
jgi:hypothetical protein